MSRSARRFGSALIVLALAGCGYRTGLVLPEGRSLGVEIFDNSSRRELLPDLERDLHAAMTDVLVRLVAAPLVAPSRADLRVTGRILRFHRRGGVRDEDNQLLETGVRVEAEGEVLDRDGNVLSQTRVASESGFVLDDAAAESAALDRVLRNIAERLVLDLIAPLAYEPDP